MNVSVPTIKTREIIKKRKQMIPSDVLTVKVFMRLIQHSNSTRTAVVNVPPSNILTNMRNVYEARMIYSVSISPSCTQLPVRFAGFYKSPHCFAGFYKIQGKTYVPFDAVLVCENVRFNTHVFVLVMRSKTLEAQISPSFLQAGECECKRPVIKEIRMQEGITAHTTESMLRFMYLDELEIECIEEASNLLYAADFYQIDRLYEICQNVIADKLTVDNAADMLTLAEFHSVAALKAAIVRFVVRNIASVSCTPGTTHFFICKIDNNRLVFDQHRHPPHAGYLTMARTWPKLTAELIHLVATGSMPPTAAAHT